MAKKQSLNNWLQTHLVSLSRIHFAYAGVYIAAIVVFDAWNLITTEMILERWMVGASMLVVSALVWYAARFKTKTTMYYQGLVWALVALDVFVATHAVFAQRGIASKAVLLYVIAIITSAALLSRVAIFTTAIVSVALYSLACVRYFYINPGQAYKVELYGEVAFYSGLLFVVSALLWSLIATNQKA